MSTLTEIEALDAANVMQTYGRRPVAFVRGEGTKLFDTEGKEYLDFLSGLAVTSLGHAHPEVAAAIGEQARTLLHVSNLYYNDVQPRVAARLNALLGGDGRVFFCNSGAEANECAIKLARRYGQRNGGPDRFHVISAYGSFHGRTLTTLAATGQPQKQETFQPLPEGFRQVAFDDLEALATAMDERVAAVLLEAVQGEGGVIAASAEYLRGVRELCDEREALLIIDEVQTGLGRTGRWFGFEHSGVRPDVVTMAKALGNGAPIGACWARADIAAAFAPGDHATTFGGQPLVASAALAVLEVMERERVPERAERAGTRLVEGLAKLDGVAEVRGVGLLIVAELAPGSDAKAVAQECLAAWTRGERGHPDGASVRATAAGLGLRDRRRGSPGRRRARGVPSMTAHLLEIDDLDPVRLGRILSDAVAWKADPSMIPPVLAGRGAAALFQKPSARTRVSIEMAVATLGGHPIQVRDEDVGLDVRETVEDVARTLASMCAVIAARVFDHETLVRMVAVVDVPVVNLLSDRAHPCQALADLLTIREHFGDLDGRRIAYVGDGNNVAASLAYAAALSGAELAVASPDGYELDADVVDRARNLGGSVELTNDAYDAVRGADVVYTDVWTSMGQETEREQRLRAFTGWTVDAALMKAASEHAIFMHCLPAHRGEEVASEVIDGPQSVVWQQAGNRMHSARALLVDLVGGAADVDAGQAPTPAPDPEDAGGSTDLEPGATRADARGRGSGRDPGHSEP